MGLDDVAQDQLGVTPLREETGVRESDVALRRTVVGNSDPGENVRLVLVRWRHDRNRGGRFTQHGSGVVPKP